MRMSKAECSPPFSRARDNEYSICLKPSQTKARPVKVVQDPAHQRPQEQDKYSNLDMYVFRTQMYSRRSIDKLLRPSDRTASCKQCNACTVFLAEEINSAVEQDTTQKDRH